MKVIQSVRRFWDLNLIICNWDKDSSQKLVIQITLPNEELLILLGGK